jgi:hypothetical protein
MRTPSLAVLGLFALLGCTRVEYLDCAILIHGTLVAPGLYGRIAPDGT